MTLLLDANTTSVLTLAISAAGTAFGIWITYKQSQTTKKLNEVDEKVNGHTSMLSGALLAAQAAATAAEKVASRGEGKEAGRAEERIRQAEAGVAAHAEPNAPASKLAVPVVVVDSAKDPLHVTQIEDNK